MHTVKVPRELEGFQKDYLERKIFLKKQLIFLTEKEIEILEKELCKNKTMRRVN